MLIWPKEITASRQLLVGGAVEYNLSHTEVGEIGRIVVIPAGPASSELRHEVFVGADDGHHERRLSLMASVTDLVTQAFARAGHALHIAT